MEDTGVPKGSRKSPSSGRFWSSWSRSEKRTNNNLGIIPGGSMAQIKRYRSTALEELDAYYENRQYAGKPDWNQDPKAQNFIPLRDRKPLISIPFGKMFCSRVTSKLIGQSTFPSLKIEDDPDATAFFEAVVTAAKLKSRMLEPIRRMLGCGSWFVRFAIMEGSIKFEHFASKFCYPKFDLNGNLESIEIKYVFDDVNDLDEKGAPKKKWFKMDLGKESDILYDNPPATEQGEPTFAVVSKAEHNLGFVQGEWFRTAENRHNPDGPGILSDITDLIDELNYSLSQSSRAIAYNQDPQLAINSMDEEEMDTLIRSAVKAWNLGKEGKAAFLESSMNGVDKAVDFRDKVKLNIQDIIRVVLLDPEKLVASAQSAKAMEVLHGPMLELIYELRPMIEEKLISLVLKIGLALLEWNSRGQQTIMNIPKDFHPSSFNLTALWPEVFPKTLEDLNSKLNAAMKAASGNIISRETAMRWVAKDFGIEDVEEELAKIAAQPVLNPWGGGF